MRCDGCTGMNLRQFWLGIATLLVAFCVQAGAAVYWAGAISARMAAVEKNLDRVETRLDGFAQVQPRGRVE